jgi:hypothetical protein
MPKATHEIRQRTKGGPITATADLPLRKALKREAYSLKLKIVASPEDWWSLYTIALADPEYLGKLILINLAKPVYEEKITKIDHPPPRGIHAPIKGKDVVGFLMHEARKYAAAAYTVVSYWVKRPNAEWSDYFKEIIKGLMKKKKDITSPKAKKYVSIDIVIALFEEKYGNRLQGLNIQSILHESYFRNTYLKRNYLEAAKHFFELEDNKLTIDELFEILI